MTDVALPTTERAELMAFARRLNAIMARHGMSQSDLARAMWGSMTDTRGRDVARNRDRISLYTRGMQMPEDRTIRKLAEVLSVPVTALVPDRFATPGEGTAAGAREAVPAEMGLTMVAGAGDRALLTLNKTLSLRLATQILSLIVAESAAESAAETASLTDA